jgi:glucuronate isomerase
VDSLEYHIKLKEDSGFKVNVVPAFRPDNALYIERAVFGAYARQLAEVSGVKTDSFASLIMALENRMVFFKSQGAFVSDSGIDYFEWIEASPEEVEKIYAKALKGEELSFEEIHKYRSAFVTEMARVYNRNGIVMQLHIGTYLDANTVQKQTLGVSTGFDCTDDRTHVRSVGFLLDKLTVLVEMPRMILFPLNAGLMENFAILAAAFCGGGIKARVQLGAPWWFNDQEYGIRRQFQASANLYPLSLSVGMLTDSRSFLSYPRHELFRRVLCNYLGELIEKGEYFSDESAQKAVIQNLCYYNAKEFFGL